DAQPAELEQQPQQGMRAPQRPPMRADAQPAELEQQPQQGMRAPQRPPMRPDAQSAGRFERPMRSERPPMPNEEPMANPMQSRTDEQFARPPMKRPPMPQGGQAEGAMRPERQPMAPDGRRQPAQRPAPRMEDEQPKRKQLPNAERYARDVQERNPHASVDRRPYDFEEEGEEAEPRRGGVLLPIVIVLLVIGGLLAGICLPDWASVNGGIGTALNGVKTSIVSAVTSVKEMIFPTEAPIKSFSATASEGAAPTQVVFNVQTTKNVAGIRIADDLGKNVYTNAYNADTEASGEVINNSNVLLWKPAYTVEDAYNGGYTVYVQKKDGTESEGMRSEGTVTIAAAKPAMPAIQGFECDTLEGAVPATLGFTIETSTEVTGVRIVDSYNNPVATLFDTDGNTADSSMTENGELRRWSIFEDVTAAYAGNYTLQYQTSSDDLSFTPSDYDVQVSLSAQAPQTDAADPTAQNPLSDEAMADNEGMAEGQPEGDAVMAIAQTDAEEPIAMPEASEQVVAEPTLEPTLAPTPEPEPTATPIPATTPLAKLEAAADEAASPESIKLDATLYKNGKPTKTFEREKPISMLSPFTTSDEGSNYAVWKQAGVLTFRSGPMRQNASYGTAEVENKTLTQLWTQPVGSMKVNKATLYGVGYPGQPVIVKWPTEVRQRMAMEDAMKQVTALKEVIVSGQDGNIYFYNLLDGTATREPIKLGAPSAGGLSVATNGTPILGVGQSHSKLANKNVKNGYHLINLLTNKKEELYECDGKDKNSNYTGVLGAALFESKTGTMFFGSQNGVLYSVALGSQEEAYDHQSGKITLGSEKQGYKTLAARQSEKNTNINASIAMYNNYIYYADAAGIVQCVNANTLQPVWAVNTGDAVSATPALDMENESTVALYTGNTILNMGKKGTCTIRKLDALTGAEKWQYAVPELGYTTEYDIGCMASPVVGQQSIQDLVIFTVSKGAAGSAVIAFDKQSGTVAWETPLPSTTVSSPVAVYNESGDAWILQAEKDGNVNLLDAKSGAILNTLKLDGEIEASPAVYGNLMIIGTTGKNKGSVVCVKID
ncbi:MAG: PQQ-binding-like beta-propeller repeat protein, partial [Clostridia bacterium]